MFPLNDETRPAARQGLWVGFATGLYGLSFGALAVAAGLSVWQAVALSALLFSGGSQFALIGVLASGGSGVAAVAASSLLGLRNGFYGLQVARILEVAGLAPRGRGAADHRRIDRRGTGAARQRAPARGLLGHGLVGLCVLERHDTGRRASGQCAGRSQGLGAGCRCSGAFIALLWPRLTTPAARGIALAAGAVALLATPLVPPGIPILLAALVAVLAGSRPGRFGPAPTDEGDELTSVEPRP